MSTIASAISGLRRHTIVESGPGTLPWLSAVARIMARIYDWYLSGIAVPSAPLTTVAAPIEASGRMNTESQANAIRAPAEAALLSTNATTGI